LRIFFAVFPTPSALEKLTELLAAVRRRCPSDEIRWVLPEQLHYTLKFLGEQPETRVSDAIAAARRAARSCSPFDIVVGGLGAFPNAQHPKVVWVGTNEGAPTLTALSARLDEELAQVGFEREARPFVPHLTLARTKSRAAEQAVVRGLAKVGEVNEVARIRVDRFALMQSQLSPKGSTYTVVESFPLEPLSSSP